MSGETNETVEQAVRRLRREGAARAPAATSARAVAALARVADLWQRRLETGWAAPNRSPFPWPMVRVSLEGLLPGLRTAGEWRSRAASGQTDPHGPAVVAHVLAGNTPLLAWPGLAACLLAGSASFVKMSRDETLWPRLFVDSLAAVDADLAALIHLDVWPGDDPRTGELARTADAVIAYGSDRTIAAMRAATPVTTPFWGYGHALSVGIMLAGEPSATATGFARDILLYDQGGCLSPHALFVEGGAAEATAFGEALATALPAAVDALEVPPVTDPGVALAVRRARDLALFMPGATVRGDDALRWTVIILPRAEPITDAPPGHGVVTVQPIADMAAEFGPALGAARRRVSAAGVAGPLPDTVRQVLLAEGVSRICAPGEMQAPPLDWPNGGRDLLATLLREQQPS